MSISLGGTQPTDLKRRGARANALKLDPNSAEAHVSVGWLAIKRRYAEAAIAFDRAIEKDPTLSQAYYLYGRVLFGAEMSRNPRNCSKRRNVCDRTITRRGA
jgi:tetratricopeptide (TPR) repeat protein